jgi:hypothetical protein
MNMRCDLLSEENAGGGALSMGKIGLSLDRPSKPLIASSKRL